MGASIPGMPTHVQFTMRSDTIAQVQIDQTLAGNARFLRHFLEIANDIVTKSYRHRFSQFGSVGILRVFIFERSYSSFITDPGNRGIIGDRPLFSQQRCLPIIGRHLLARSP